VRRRAKGEPQYPDADRILWHPQLHLPRLEAFLTQKDLRCESYYTAGLSAGARAGDSLL